MPDVDQLEPTGRLLRLARGCRAVSGRATELGDLLRHWRTLRGRSQLELAFDAGTSQRHISFIESGRSGPSRSKLIDIADALDIPLRDRNSLLLAAGYAPLYPEAGLDGPELASVVDALRRMLRQHEPYPAVVLDRHWNVVQANGAAPRFFGSFVDLAARPTPRNLLHLMFDPAGMRPFIANWDEVSRSLLERVRREAVGHVMDDATRELLTTLKAYSDPGGPPRASRPASVAPVVPIGFLRGGQVLNYFSMVATVGTPQTVAAQELRLECMFPADADTEHRHLELMAAAGQQAEPTGT